MHVNDEAEILSRLGILDSTLESPRKSPQTVSSKPDKPRYVDVDISGTVVESDTEDDDLLFDQNSLLNAKERRTTDKIRESWNCKFIFIFLALFATGCYHFVVLLNQTDVSSRLIPITLLGFSAGLLTGNALAKLWFLRFNINHLFLFSLLVSPAALHLSTNASSLGVLFGIIGFASGCLEYGSVCSVFVEVSPVPRRRYLWVLFISASLGALALTCVASVEYSQFYDHLQLSSALERTARSTDIPPLQVISNITMIDPAIGAPKKPKVAVGSAVKPSKTQQNIQGRQNPAGQANQPAPSVVNSSLSNDTTTTTVLTTPATTPLILPTTVTVPLATQPTQSDAFRFSQGIRLALFSISGFVVLFVTFSSCLCCLSCKPFAEAKVAKLNRVDTFGLTKGSRLRLHAVFMLSGATDALLSHLLLSFLVPSSSQRMAAAFFALDLLARLFFLVIGGCYTLFWLWLLLFISLGAALLAVLTNVSLVYVISCSVVLSSWRLLLVVYIDQLLSPPSSSIVNAFIFSTAIGRFFFSASVFLASLAIGTLVHILWVFLVLLVCLFFLLVRSLKKAYRFKVINEYDVNELSNPRGYTSLLTLQEDIPQISDQEDEL